MYYARPYDDSHASNHNDLSSVIISLHLYLSKPHYTQLVRRYLNVAGKIHFLGKLCLKGHHRHLEDDMDWEKLTLVLKYQGGNLVHLCSFLHQLMVH